VVRAFGIDACVDRFADAGEEVVVVTLTSIDAARVAESRLHAALEAALNCEVRIVTGEAGQSSPARQPGRGSGSGGT
jgi:hypothetical protein